MQVSPYIFFYGKAEEAMTFYHSIFGGKLEISRNSDMPSDGKLPAEWREKVMHSSLSAEGVEIMASDGGPDSKPETESNIALSIGLSDEKHARELFEKLSAGGKVQMPMEKQFWGAIFGMLTDKYGIDWMINCGP